MATEHRAQVAVFPMVEEEDATGRVAAAVFGAILEQPPTPVSAA